MLSRPTEAGPRERFARLAAEPEERVDPIAGALLVAAEARPDLDVARALERLGVLAREAARPLASCRAPAARVAGLCRFMWEAGFRGNRDDYYDPRNSDLDLVLERRTGIPITLALVYLAIGRHLGWPLFGVSFPGHFLVKYVEPAPAAEATIVIDPFDAKVLGEDDLHARVKAVLGPDAHYTPALLRASTGREILARILGNLKQVHVQRGELALALECVERILLLAPQAHSELRDRGLLYHRLECWAAARDDLERYLAVVPGDPTADVIREALAESRERAGLLH